MTIQLPETAKLTVAVTDLLGRQVALLHDGTAFEGAHSYSVDGTKLASGVYLITASTNRFGSQAQKMVLVK